MKADKYKKKTISLKESFLSLVVLKYSGFTKEFIFTTDVSDVACGTVLDIIEKEYTAIHWENNYFKPYLYGRKFTVKTDHRPLVYLFGMINQTPNLTRMRLD